MRLLNKSWVLFTIAVATGSMTYAQAPDPGPGSGSASAQGTVEGSVSVSGSAKVSVAEMATKLGELQTQTKDDLQHVLHLQAVARKDKDVIKLTCVNDKYVRLKAESNVFDAQKRDLLASLEKDSRVTSYDSMSVAADGVHKAREEAERCMGEPELGDSDSKNSFTPPDITDDPTKGLSFDVPGSVFEPPAYASPWS